MKNHNGLIAGLSIILLLNSPLGLAQSLTEIDPNRVNTANRPYATMNAESSDEVSNFCANFVINDSQHGEANAGFTRLSQDRATDIRGLAGRNNGAWNSEDDAWCAKHGVQTSSSATPTGTPGPSSTSTPTASSGCGYPMFAYENGDGSCEQVKQNINRCKFRGKAIENYCLAYYAYQEGLTWQKTLLAIDFAIAATCFTACATGGVWNAACTAAGIGGTAAEGLATFTMRNGEVGRMVNGILTLGAGSTTVANGIVNQFHETHSGANDNKTACASGAFFTLLGALRAYNAIDNSNLRAETGKKVAQFISTATGVGGDGRPGPSGGPVAIGPPGGPGSDPANRAPGSTTTQPTTQSRVEAALDCVLNGRGSTSQCSAAAATQEAQALNNDGGRQLAPLAAKINPEELFNKVKSSGFGGAMEAAMGGQAGEIGSAAAQLAQYAQNHAQELGGVTSGSAYASGGGGGGGGSKGGDSGMPNFGSLFGGAGGQPMGAGAGSMQFAGVAKDTDIWHANSHMNIFEIVSGKITQVSTRVK